MTTTPNPTEHSHTEGLTLFAARISKESGLQVRVEESANQSEALWNLTILPSTDKSESHKYIYAMDNADFNTTLWFLAGFSKGFEVANA